MVDTFEIYDENKQAYVLVTENETITISASKRKASQLFQAAWTATKSAPRSTRRWLSNNGDLLVAWTGAALAFVVALITAAIFFGALPLALILNFGFAWYTAILVGLAVQYLVIKAIRAVATAGEMAANTYRTQKMMRQMMKTFVP